MNEEDAKYQKAKERVEQLKGFYIHIVAYVLVNLGLFLLNIITTPDDLWFYIPLLLWGVLGVVPHGIYVFGLSRQFGADWEEKKIREIMEKEEEA